MVRSAWFVLPAAFMLAACGRSPATKAPSACDAPSTREAVAACLAIELREADGRINRLYEAVMAKRDAAGRETLRADQRKWLAIRDRDCQIAGDVEDRNQWYELVAAEPRRAVCVTSHTRYRIAVLEALDAGRTPPTTEEFLANSASNAAQMATTLPGAGGQPRLPTRHAEGKWYYEVTVDRAAVAEFGARSLMAGFTATEEDEFVGKIFELHANDFGTLHVGCAIDLDNGMAYFREDGNWHGREPGGNRGLRVKLGQDFLAQVRGGDRMAELLSSGALKPNFGDTPFLYPPPPGYQKWRQ